MYWAWQEINETCPMIMWLFIQQRASAITSSRIGVDGIYNRCTTVAATRTFFFTRGGYFKFLPLAGFALVLVSAGVITPTGGMRPLHDPYRRPCEGNTALLWLDNASPDCH